MHCHCGTNNRAPRWTFTDPCKPEVRPGAREESASPAWLAIPAMNARDTTKLYYITVSNPDTKYSGSCCFFYMLLQKINRGCMTLKECSFKIRKSLQALPTSVCRLGTKLQDRKANSDICFCVSVRNWKRNTSPVKAASTRQKINLF